VIVVRNVAECLQRCFLRVNKLYAVILIESENCTYIELTFCMLGSLQRFVLFVERILLYSACFRWFILFRFILVQYLYALHYPAQE